MQLLKKNYLHAYFSMMLSAELELKSLLAAFISTEKMMIRVGQFSQVSCTVPSFCRIFHPDSKNGLLSALRRIPSLHSLPDGNPAMWLFLIL